MIFEFNIILAIIKTHLADLSVLIDAGLITYVIYLKKELNKKATKESLWILSLRARSFKQLNNPFKIN